MANPTFDGKALTTDAPAERIGSPQARVFRETLPGVKGEFVQQDLCGGRDITVAGLYRGLPAATTLDAQAALKAAIRTVQAKVPTGAAPYVGVDGHTYETCVLMSFEPVGEVRYLRAGGNYQATVRIRAVVRDLDP